jgi:hypothetical protein
LQLFQGNIKDSIQNGVKGAVTSVIDTNLNQFLQAIPLSHPIGTWGVIDYSLASAVGVSPTGVTLPLQAVVKSASGAVPPFGPTQPLPSFLAGSSMLEVTCQLFVY